MEHYCSNCNEVIIANFCSHCGQKKYKRIDKKYIWEEVQYSVLHTNKGFLYSVKKIIKNPGKTAREFIDGKRVNHYKPILLVFVLSGISSFISYKVIGLKEAMSEMYSQENMNSQFMNDYISFVSSYNSLVMLLFIPLIAIITKITFRKWGHNYYEHIIMNAYVLSFYTLLTMVIVFPVMYLYKYNPEALMSLSILSTLVLMPIVLVWFYKGFYAEKSLKSIIGKMFLMLGLMIIGYIALIILGIIIGILIAILKGPESIQYLMPPPK
jgi:hypothetical protein